MRVFGVFSGIAGIELGFERAGYEIVGFCEIDAFCRRVIGRRWPGVRLEEDVRELRGDLGADVIVGGFPCQDISVAGKGAGIEGARSGLWSEMRRVVGESRPRWVVAENVPALRTRGADRVLQDLEELGYACWPLVVGADDVGAPHRRKRVWIVAHAHGEGKLQPGGSEQSQRRWSGDSGQQAVRRGDGRLWAAEPDVGRMAYGVPARMDRLRALGNAAVPTIPELIARAILRVEQAVAK